MGETAREKSRERDTRQHVTLEEEEEEREAGKTITLSSLCRSVFLWPARPLRVISLCPFVTHRGGGFEAGVMLICTATASRQYVFVYRRATRRAVQERKPAP